MVRHYKRKTERGQAKEEQYKVSANKVKNGTSVREAARQHHLCAVSLSRYIKRTKKDVSFTPGYSKHKQVFTAVQELLLAKHVNECAELHFGLSLTEARKMAYQWAIKYGISHPPSWDSNKVAGEDWLLGFRQRHKLTLQADSTTARNMETQSLIQNIKQEPDYESQLVKKEANGEEECDMSPFIERAWTSSPSLSFLENSFLYCEKCQLKYEGGCPDHGPIIYMDNAEEGEGHSKDFSPQAQVVDNKDRQVLGREKVEQSRVCEADSDDVGTLPNGGCSTESDEMFSVCEMDTELCVGGTSSGVQSNVEMNTKLCVAGTSTSTTDRKRKCISLEMKVMLIEKVDEKLKSKSEICREHDIPSSTLHTILKDRDNIMSAFSSGSFHQKRKKIRKPNYEDVDCALHTWFQQARSKNIPISGPILIEKRKELAKSLGHTNFTLSMGWLNRFKVRHGIALKEVCGEAGSGSYLLNKSFTRLIDIAPISVTANEHLSVDETSVPIEELLAQDVAQNILEERAKVEEEGEEETRNTAPKITTKAASQAVETLRMFFMQQADSSDALTKLNFIQNLVDDFAIKVPKQCTIDSFSKPRDTSQ